MSRRHLTVGPAIALVASATVTISTLAPAAATTAAQLRSVQAQAQQLASELRANRDRAEVLDEQYLEAQQAVADANRGIATATTAMASTEAHAAELRSRLGDQAALLYMGAGNNDPMGIDVTNIQELGSRTKYSEAAAAQATQILGDLEIADEQLHVQQRDLEHRRADAQQRAHEAASARAAVAQADSQIQGLLASADANVKRLEAKLEAEKAAAAAAAERARLAALARAAAASAHTNGRRTGGITDPSVGVDPGPAPAPNPGAAAAIAYAKSKIGDPYVFAAAGPNAFDCSGLTMMAWAAGGVSMAHGSQAQYDSFPHVRIADLQPGDLVFFGSSGPANHHVGLYVGNGTMIEAPFTGAVVRYATIYRPDLVPLGARP